MRVRAVSHVATIARTGFGPPPTWPSTRVCSLCPSDRGASIDSEPALPYTLAHALALGAQPALEGHAVVVSVTETSGAQSTLMASR